MASIAVSVDLRGVHLDKTIATLRTDLRDAVARATAVVWVDARDRANWASVGYASGKGISAAARLTPALPAPGPLRVITGTLLRSIQQRVEQVTPAEARGTVGSPLVYAGVHERGNSHTPARPFLAPALERRNRQVVDLIRAAAPGT